jgi:predicted phosphodiesterase
MQAKQRGLMDTARILVLVALMATCGSRPAIGWRGPLLSSTQDLALIRPTRSDSVRFAVIGDSGTGDAGQWRIAERLTAARANFPFDFVLMLGDNLYGDEDPEDYRENFERPYRALLDRGVTFYAVLGNHDDPSQRFYKWFNMRGKHFYTFDKGNVRFFALNSNYMDAPQIDWVTRELCESDEDWKIVFFHHPIYSSGDRHGSDLRLREVLEPIFVDSGVEVVFAGHDHIYERLKPQKGVHYFVSGGAGKLARGDIERSGRKSLQQASIGAGTSCSSRSRALKCTSRRSQAKGELSTRERSHNGRMRFAARRA